MDTPFLQKRIMEIEAEEKRDHAEYVHEYNNASPADRVFIRQSYDAARRSRMRIIAELQAEERARD